MEANFVAPLDGGAQRMGSYEMYVVDSSELRKAVQPTILHTKDPRSESVPSTPSGACNRGALDVAESASEWLCCCTAGLRIMETGGAVKKCEGAYDCATN